MAALIRAYDWPATALGAVAAWPERLRLAVDICLGSAFPSFVWWGAELTQIYNDAGLSIQRAKHPAALGRPAREGWSEVWPEVGPLAATVLETGESVLREDLAVMPERGGAGEAASFTFSCSAIRGAGPRPAGLYITAIETTGRIETERRCDRAEAELRDAAERLGYVVDSASEYAIVTLDAAGRIRDWNAGAERLLGYREAEVLGRSADIFFAPEDCAAGILEREMREARATGRASDERWHMRRDGSRLWCSGVMLLLAHGGREMFLKIVRDRSEERRAAQVQQMLANELNHPVKNMLAIVQATASQTFRGSRAERHVRESFEARLSALAGGHDLLMRERWQRADLLQVVSTALQPFRTALGDRLRFGGSAILVGPQVALALTMALHELAANAARYGALANETGRVEVSWSADGAPGGRLRLRWQETGGPPVAPPRRKGLGSRLIERGLAGDLGAEVRVDYAPDGVVCTIDAPLSKLGGAAPVPLD